MSKHNKKESALHEEQELQEELCDQEQNQPTEEKDKATLYFEQLVRLQADFENYRKRVEKEKAELINFGKTEVLLSFLSLYDVLLKAKKQVESENADVKNIKQGLKMIFEEFAKVFKAQGVQIITAKGKPYDAMTQEVITTVPCAPKDDGLVLEEISSGVKMGDRVIRPAQVIVGKAPEENSKEVKKDIKQNKTEGDK
jgi:Molecular chaperone GrpE (heat shock protein)